MSILQAIILGIVEGITEFLPISSTGHLTILESLFGFSINNPDITAFTAIIQVGAVAATLVYFWKDITRLLLAWLTGLVHAEKRSERDFKYGWAIVVGSIPVAFVGLLFKNQIETTLRSLWFVGFALLLWSGVMWYADHHAKQTRHENNVRLRDTLIIGIAQCMALIPGVSRSGATMSAGLLQGFDRVTVTKLSFFLAIPALFAAAIYQTVTEFGNISNGVGWVPTIVAIVTSFIVAYVAIAWLLKFIAKHSYTVFIWYRVILGSLLLILLGTGVLSAT